VSALQLDPALILAEAARLRGDAVKDKSYQVTPIGGLVGRYLDGLAFDNYSSKTADVREPILARFSIDYAHLTIQEIVYNHLRDFTSQWAGSSVAYRRSIVSTLRVFFDWAYQYDHIEINPARKLRSPRTKDEDSQKRAYTREIIRTLVKAQTQRRDKLAVLCLYWLALRKNELRHVQAGDFDFQHNVLTVHGKGGTVLEQNVPAHLAGDIEAYFRDIGAKPNWFLLSPQKQARFGSWPLYRYELVTSDPSVPYSLSGMQRWFEGCRERAGMDDLTLHELRHTAGTHFHMVGHDLVRTQHFMRHKDPATTAREYMHLDRVRDVAEVQRRMTDPLAGDE